MTPGDRAVAEYKKRDARVAIFVHASIGAVVGALVGFYVWSWVNIRLGLHDTWWQFALFISAAALIFGVLAACFKERFWEDWRSPFWWP
jgi:hypothetical protein